MKEKDRSISLVRLVATAMIVTCHLMQYLDCELAWWFNVGVQIFLCMSGYLYGRHLTGREHPLAFYKKQFFKILLDYYVVILPVMALQLLFAADQLTASAALRALLTVGTLEGGGHLWYIPYILFCYLLTPFLMRLFVRCKHNGSAFAAFAAMLAAQLVLCKTLLTYFNPLWVDCYIIGLFLGYCEQTGRGGINRLIKPLVYLSCIGANAVQIYIDYCTDLHFAGVLGTLYALFCDYAHVALGCTLFFGLRALFARPCFHLNDSTRMQALCAWSDRYTYDVYLVHQFFISGPFALLHLTGWLPVNILLILLAIVAAGWLAKECSVRLRKGLAGR